MRRLTVLTLCALLTLGLAPFVTTDVPPAVAGESACFETGYCAENAFLEFWRGHGATRIIGLPVTQPFVDDRGLIVQFYERAIMEWHPENGPDYQVLLTLLGSDRLGARPERVAPPAPCGDGCAYLAETNHTLRGVFLNFWQTHGGLAVFGFPLTEEFTEINPSDGRPYMVQYFERNRFEYHPEYTGSEYEVLLGLLGSETLRGQPGVLARPAALVPEYSRPAVGLPARLEIPGIGVNAAVEHVGTDASGNMATPQDYWNTAWFKYGPRPGQRGNAVIAGHVDSAALNRRVVFGDLHTLTPGAEVFVTADNGARRRFIVQSVETYATNEAPLQRIFGPSDDANLNLISCIGDFDPVSRSYDRRTIVFARWDGVSR